MPVGVAHLEQAAQQARLRRYGVLASLGQLSLGGLPFPSFAREALVQLLESLELSQGALLECLADGALRCVASFGGSLESGKRLEPAQFSEWRAFLAARSFTAEVSGDQGPVSLTPLASGARGLLVRLPDDAGHPVAVLALAVLQERRFDADVRSFLQAVALLLGAALAREHQESARRQEVARLEALLDHVPVTICLKDLGGHYLYVNRRFAAYLRRPPEELLGQADEDLLPPAVALLAQASDAAVRATGQPREVEEELALPEGRRSFLVTRFPLLDSQGRLQGTGVVATDITRRKRLERELRHNEEQLRQVVNGLEDHAFILLDPEGRVASWNLGAERLKGYKAEEILGRPVSLLHEGELSRPGMVREALAQAAREGRLEVESWCVRKDGSRFLSNDTVFPLWREDGSLRGFSAVSRDITARHEAQERLRRSEARYRLVSRATQESIWDWELVQNRLEWGEQALERFGYTEGEAASHPSWWEARIHPEDREEVLSTLVRALEDREERW
ncbi:MAG: PAS domain S-box protein, partial [Archangium sp.]